jgi:nitroreductase
VRKFLDQPVEQEKINQVLEAGRIAPSAVNYQPWRFVVVREQPLKGAVCESYKSEWLGRAPVIIVVCGVHAESWIRADGKDHCDIDVAIATDHMTLAATELGLGTCWVCNFKRERLVQALSLPDGMEPVVLLPLGYPAAEPDLNRHDKQRKSLDEITFRDRGPLP